MEIFNGIDIATAGFVALATFGSVSAVNFWKKQNSRTNFLLSLLFAFGFSFVPADFGNIIANKAKDAFNIAVLLNGSYQFLGGIAKKINPTPTPPDSQFSQ